MKLLDIKNYFENYKKGTFRKIKWAKTITLKNGQTVIKEVETVGRFNINYGNLKSVKERNSLQNNSQNDSSLRPETVWLYDKLVKQTTTGKEVLIVYTTKKHRSKVVWKDTLGNKINRLEIEDLLYAKDKSKNSSVSDMFYLDIQNILKIGGK